MASATLTLDRVPIGKSCYIKKLTNKGLVRRRLDSLGFTAGCKVKVLRKSPLNSPVLYLVRNAMIALRKEDAAKIIVLPVEGL
jgi:ferrous iron transport protein A